MGFLLLLLVWCIVSFHYGFRAPRQPWQYRSQAAFIVSILLMAFVGYFEWRAYRSTSELALLIEPVPDVTDVMYVPTPGEMQGIAAALAATPRTTRTGSTPADRQATARAAGGMRRRYWQLSTTLTVRDVMAFYAAPGRLAAWTIDEQTPQMLVLRRGDESMVVFVQDHFDARHVWYLYGRPEEPAARR